MKFYILYKCWLCLIFITVRKHAIQLSVKTVKTRTVYFVLFLRICLCSRYSNLTYAPDIFANLCSLVPKFHCQLTKEKLERSPGKRSDIVQFGRWRDNFSSVLCALYSHRARSFNQWRYVYVRTFVINICRVLLLALDKIKMAVSHSIQKM